MNVADELGKLHQLKQAGAITEEEYQRAKAALLAEQQLAAEKCKREAHNLACTDDTWAMFIHLSQFCSYVVPLSGMIVPLVIWQIKKHESVVIDRHGRIVANWIFTKLILLFVFAVLCLVVIGIPLLIALAIVNIVFPIIGAVKAANGEAWAYPCSITFFTWYNDTNAPSGAAPATGEPPQLTAQTE